MSKLNRLIRRLLLGFFILAALAACETNPAVAQQSVPPPSEIAFIDLQGFDSTLASSLSAPLPQVQISFYDKISPSALPLRLQTWLSSVEAGGGKVKVKPPKSDISAKDPFLLLSLASSLWSASKLAKEAALKAQFASAQAYDAELVLKDDGNGQSVVEKVVFFKRAP
jgi:hypothetical protein